MIRVKHSLSRKLSTNILLMAIPIFILSLGVFFLHSRYLIRQEAIEDSKSVLHATLMRVSNYMSSVETSANANAWLLEENFTPSCMDTVSRRILAHNPHVLSCSVSTEPGMFADYGHLFSVYTFRDGDSIVTIHETDFDYLNKEWHRVPVATGKAEWIEPFIEHTKGTIDPNEAVATYSRPLRSKTGQVIGAIAADFSFRHLAKIVNSVEHPYPNAYFVLTGDNGRFFVHPDTAKLFRKTIYTDADPQLNADVISLGHEMTDGQQGTMHVTLNDVRCHVSYQPVPGTDWSLALVCPEDEVMTDYNQLGYVIIGLIVIGLVIIVWLCRRVVGETIQPISHLLGVIQHIAEGNYDAPIPTTDQKDDIGHLQNSFAVMQQKLRDHMGHIRQTADEIKKQNAQRARDMELAEETIRRKTVFIQNLSHQIRTPLNIIIGFANMLHDSIAERNKGKALKTPMAEENLSEVTGMMKYNAIHLKRMILMLFDSSSATGAEELMGNRQDEVSCNEVARESIDYTVDHFPRVNVELVTELSDAEKILSNRLYLMRILRELLYNAAKYSDGKHIKLHISQSDTIVCFTIQDTGPGLPENADDLLYKPFTKTDDLSVGLGLGLPLSRRHALSLGGDLVYDSSYRDGCRFMVEMPK